MEDSVRLGRIAGIPVGVNWSLLVVFWLITWSLAGARFPDQFPGHSTAAYWSAALFTALAFYASLLAHELGHSLLARRYGLEVEGITLWLFGGVARLSGEAVDPRSELRIAAVGPVVSLAAAAAFGVAAAVSGSLGTHELVAGSFAWLALINVMLGVFNMVPAAPLDGGRVLRAWLWRRHGDRYRASVTAARAGRTFGYVLIGLGLVEFAAGAGIGGLWFVFLGWFLLNAARAEESRVLLRGALAEVRVRDVMSRDPQVAPGSLTVDAFVEEHALRKRFSGFPVVSADGRLTGLVTLNDVKAVPAERRGELRVGDIARSLDEVPVARPGELLIELLERMGSRRRALVLEDGRLVGIVSPTDVARAIEWAALVPAGPGREAAERGAPRAR